MGLLYTQNTYLRPFMAPPETPDARVAVLREAFMQTMKDPELLAEAAKARLVVDARSGQELTSVVESIFALPKSIHDQLRQALIE
jgi:tripartite-type tricarboxylate transporter receptor subunit TctC